MWQNWKFDQFSVTRLAKRSSDSEHSPTHVLVLMVLYSGHSLKGPFSHFFYIVAHIAMDIAWVLIHEWANGNYSLCEPCSWRLVEFPVLSHDFQNALTFLLRGVNQIPEYPSQEQRWTSLISNEICCGARIVDFFRLQILKLGELTRTEDSKMEH